MKFCDYMKTIKPFFACSSNERFVTEIFAALCGGLLPEGLTADDPTYRKRLFSGKQKLSNPIKSFVIVKKNIGTFTAYCDDNVSAANFVMLCKKFGFETGVGHETVFGVLFNYLLEFAKSTGDDVAIKIVSTDDTKRKSDNVNPIEPVKNEYIKNFDIDALFSEHINVCFIGLGEAGTKAVDTVSQKWDKELAQADFWTLPPYGIFNFDEFTNSLENFKIVFIVVSSMSNGLDAFVDRLFEVMEDAGKLVLLILVGDESDSLLVDVKEGKYTRFIKRCSSYTIIDEKTQAYNIPASDVLNRIASGILKPIQTDGFINLDYADVRAILCGGQRLHIGFGNASGENRAFAAATAAVMRPITQQTAKNANSILMNVTMSSDVSLSEMEEAIDIVRQYATADANIIFGSTIDEESNGSVAVTLIATFDEADESVSQNTPPPKSIPPVKEEFADGIDDIFDKPLIDMFSSLRTRFHDNDDISLRYEILEIIGEGGAGRVYKAKHKTIGRIVAIKEFRTNNESFRNTSIRTEIDVLKTIKHHYLPQLYDVIISDSVTWIVMEYIDGKDLNAIVQKNGAVDGSKLLKYLYQLCEAINYLHTSRPPIIHGDIKPNNIVITSNDNICLIDFNVAHFATEQKEGRPLGVTHGYSAPELYFDRVSGRDYRREYYDVDTKCLDYDDEVKEEKSPNKGGKLSVQSDIYSIGATAFFLATANRPPYLVSDVLHYVKVDKKLRTIIERCCDSSPNRRFVNVAAIINELKKVSKKGFANYKNARIPMQPMVFPAHITGFPVQSGEASAARVSEHTELVYSQD